MPGRTILKQRSTGGGAPDRRLDALELIVTQNADETERGFDTGGKWELVYAIATITAKPWQLLLCNPTAAGFTVLLPPASECKLSQVIVKNDSGSANTLTVRVAGGGTIDGATSSAINSARALKQFTSDGKEWKEASSTGGGALVVQTGTDANVTALPNRLVYMPTLTANRTVFAPATPSDGTWFRLLVTNAQAFQVTVNGNGKNIDDRFGAVASTYIISNDGTLLEFVYIAAAGTWMIL